MSWLLTREQRAKLKTLDRLNQSLALTQVHIIDLIACWNTAPLISAAVGRAQHIVDTIRRVATDGE
jgi:hypothetical protein